MELKIPSDPNSPESPCVAIEVKKEVYVPLFDLQGNIACLLDPRKAKVVESYRYSVYGEEEIVNGRGKTIKDSAIGNPWRYRGKRVDKEVGLIYFGYRYYDPEVGRWMSPDPAGTIDGPNLYAYVRNNPLRYVDHFGFYSEIDPNCACVKHDHPGWKYRPSDCVCICGKNNSDETYIPRGGDIKSAVGGMGHGVADYVIDSLHNFDSATLFIGCAELDISLHERMHLIEAAEQSQMSQRDALGSALMQLLSIDESDEVYQQFRSHTTTGLHVASMVAAGYGVVRGIVAFTGLGRVATRFTNAGSSSNGFLGAKKFVLKNAEYQESRNVFATKGKRV